MVSIYDLLHHTTRGLTARIEAWRKPQPSLDLLASYSVRGHIDHLSRIISLFYISPPRVGSQSRLRHPHNAVRMAEDVRNPAVHCRGVAYKLQYVRYSFFPFSTHDTIFLYPTAHYQHTTHFSQLTAQSVEIEQGAFVSCG